MPKVHIIKSEALQKAAQQLVDEAGFEMEVGPWLVVSEDEMHLYCACETETIAQLEAARLNGDLK